MGCFYIAGILVIAVLCFWFGEIWYGCCCVFGAYIALVMYNRFNGSGKPTFTFEQCKKEWEERERERGK